MGHFWAFVKACQMCHLMGAIRIKINQKMKDISIFFEILNKKRDLWV